MKPMRVRFVNEYKLIYMPDHPSAMTSKDWNGFVYEHIYLVEKEMGRVLNNNEVVHHLDGNRKNNNISNLIVLSRSSHARLHKWIEQGAPYLKEYGEQGVNSGKSKVSKSCVVCGITLQYKQVNTCSIECKHTLAHSKSKIPSKERLAHLLESNSREGIGRLYGVSGNAVKKWQKKYNLL